MKSAEDGFALIDFRASIFWNASWQKLRVRPVVARKKLAVLDVTVKVASTAFWMYAPAGSMAAMEKRSVASAKAKVAYECEPYG
jgi:hypothetical protein